MESIACHSYISQTSTQAEINCQYYVSAKIRFIPKRYLNIFKSIIYVLRITTNTSKVTGKQGPQNILESLI